MKKIKVRTLDFWEVAQLDKDSVFYVKDPEYHSDVLVQAKKSRPFTDHELTALDELENGVRTRELRMVNIETVFGHQYPVSAERVFVEDREGAEYRLIEAVGTQVSLTFFAPGMEGEAVLERAFNALRKEFGIGVLQVRQYNHRQAREDGLPSVLGVLDNRIAKYL